MLTSTGTVKECRCHQGDYADSNVLWHTVSLPVKAKEKVPRNHDTGKLTRPYSCPGCEWALRLCPPPDSVLLKFRLPEESRFDFLLGAVGIALNGDRGGMVQDPIEDGGSDDRVTEDLIPQAEG